MAETARRNVFALVGAAGYVARKHVAAIESIDGELICAYDPHDSVGYLDRSHMNCRYTNCETEFTEFIGHWPDRSVNQFVVVCSPTDLHLRHIALALRHDIDVICEKPLVANRSELEVLLDLSGRSEGRVLPVMQLRRHAAMRTLREHVKESFQDHVFDVELIYRTPRGPWYGRSWKGNPQRSGGLAVNIGIHIWDLLLWTFGPAVDYAVTAVDEHTIVGAITCRRARIRWELSTSAKEALTNRQAKPNRTLLVDGVMTDLSDIACLHIDEYRGMVDNDFCSIGEAVESLLLSFDIADAAN